jgi:hypothetical protein
MDALHRRSVQKRVENNAFILLPGLTETCS